MDDKEVQVGRELDEWIAENVMNQTDYEHDEIGETSAGNPYCIRCHEVGSWGDSIFGGSKCIPFYSTDIAAAWQVVEQKRFIGSMEIEWDAGNRWHCGFASLGGGYFEAWADTAPLAICLAARKSVAPQR